MGQIVYKGHLPQAGACTTDNYRHDAGMLLEFVTQIVKMPGESEATAIERGIMLQAARDCCNAHGIIPWTLTDGKTMTETRDDIMSIADTLHYAAGELARIAVRKGK